MFKLIRRLFTLAFLLVVLVVVGFFSIDAIAEKAIEAGGTYALGVETIVDEADVGVLSGSFDLEGLRVRNPQGFKAPYILEIKQGETKLDFGSIFKGKVDIPSLAINGVALNLENKGDGTNYGVLLDNLKRFESKGGSKDGKPDDKGGEKRFIIRELVIRDIRCNTDLVPILGSLTPPLDIPELRLTDIGGKDGQGVNMGELAAVLIQSILQGVATKGQGILPSQLTGDLGGKLGDLFRAGGQGVSGIQDVLKSGQGILDQLGGKKK